MKLRLQSVKDEISDIKSFIFDPEEPISWQPGQYLYYNLPHPDADDRKDHRWFTVSAAPYENHVMLTTRIIGDKASSFKKALAALQPGDEVEADPPEGDFVAENPEGEYVFVAGGIGITPFRSILKQLDHDGHDLKATMLYANRDGDYVFHEELADLGARHPDFHVQYFTDPRHIEADDIQAAGKAYQNPTYYVSGPEPMVEHYVDVFKSLGIPDERVKTDYFPGYEWPLK